MPKYCLHIFLFAVLHAVNVSSQAPSEAVKSKTIVPKTDNNAVSNDAVSIEDCQNGDFLQFEQLRKSPEKWQKLSAEQLPNYGFAFGDSQEEVRENARKIAVSLLLDDYKARYGNYVVEAISKHSADYVNLGNDYENNLQMGETTRKMRRKYKTDKKYYLSFENLMYNREVLVSLFDCIGSEAQNRVIMFSKNDNNFPTPGASDLADKAIGKMEEIFTDDRFKLTVKSGYLNPCSPIDEKSDLNQRLEYFKCISANSSLNPDIVYLIKSMEYDYDAENLKATVTIRTEGFNTKTLTYISVQEFKGEGYSTKGDAEPIRTANKRAIENAISKNEQAIFEQFAGQMYNYIRYGSEVIINLPQNCEAGLIEDLRNDLRRKNFLLSGSLKDESKTDLNGQNVSWFVAKLSLPCVCSESDFAQYLKNTINSKHPGYRVNKNGKVYDVVKQ